MTARINRLQGKFPEPQFTQLQAEVFAEVQAESPEFAQVLAREQAQATALRSEPTTYPPMVRFGAFIDEKLVGWSCGWFERGHSFYMANSGVVSAHRRHGIYSALLDAVIDHAAAHGTHVVRSQHSVLNKPVLICKLRRGFHITGFNVSAQMGSLVELSLHLSPARGALFASRVIPLTPPA